MTQEQDNSYWPLPPGAKAKAIEMMLDILNSDDPRIQQRAKEMHEAIQRGLKQRDEDGNGP